MLKNRPSFSVHRGNLRLPTPVACQTLASLRLEDSYPLSMKYALTFHMGHNWSAADCSSV
jgi:hypothetical protein